MNFDTSLLDKSGITQAELAWLSKVSRVTAGKWARGSGVHSLLEARVRKLSAALGAAIDANDLPLPSGVDHVATPKYGNVRPDLAKVLRKHLG